VVLLTQRALLELFSGMKEALPLIDVTEQAANGEMGGSESRLQRPWYYS